ncbi:MAG TPA: glycosyltransferase family 4 protein [Candidatus Udaeobacter sp.]|jgi:glycosyltransferase involved in cell wall biosynthesis|nr:glycosyltransferase family 4 protein [Candidatus Udaeobacter sp.]
MTEAPRPRVLVVGPLPPPLGGVQLMNRMLVRSSLSRDFELHTVDTSKRVLRWAVERQSWRTPLYFLRDVSNLIGALGRLRPRLVYLHAASGFSFIRDWALMTVAKLSGARVVCHYHGTLHTVFPSVRTPIGRALGRWMMGAADRVIVLGPTYQSEMGRAWRRGDLTWSPNLVDVDLFERARPGAALPGIESGDLAVLFVGRLSEPKGILELFSAAPRVIERVPRARLVLLGVAEDEARESWVREEARRAGIESRVTFLGSLEDEAKAGVYAASAIYVSPSRTEAFPLTIPEAMAAGLPMVVTAVGAIPDHVKDGEDGFLIPPRDPLVLADRIVRLLEDEPLRQRISAHLRERARREYAIEVGAARVRDVWRDALGVQPGAGSGRSRSTD